MTWRAHCRDCGTDHEPAAHRSADAMDREANRRTAAQRRARGGHGGSGSSGHPTSEIGSVGRVDDGGPR